MKFIALFRSERSGKETTSELIFPDNIPPIFAERWAKNEALKLEKESYPPWKLIELKESTQMTAEEIKGAN